MAVSRRQIILRGLTMRCPNCGARTLFSGLFKANERCSVCGAVWERGNDAFYLGASAINYAVTSVLLLVPLLILVFKGTIAVLPAVIIALAWCVIFPAIFWRPSRSLWLMTWFLMFPHELPANQRRAGPA